MAAATSAPPATAPQPAQPPMLNHDLAIKSVEHAQTYYSILEAIPGHKVRLTRCDDDLHRDFLETFPELAAPAEGDKRPDPVSRITELSVKSPDAQPKWQALAAKYAGKISGPRDGTLIRNNVADEYTQSNTMFLWRIQFYCYEITRNKRGLNDWIFLKEQQKKKAGRDAQSHS